MTILQKLEKIAWLKLGIATLETRTIDSLDFHEVSVTAVRAALAAAYKAGFDAGKRARRP
jgi:hypothetical protein